MLIATAGHVDHGKTALVRALTGVDTDRLPEEKQRGLTIDLGFAYSRIGEGRTLAFVDVPGHEKFVRNMLAGVAGIDFALLVVAADDGPRPQTHEHLAILELLGIRRGAVALTKVDRVDEDRMTAVSQQIEALLAPTGLAGAPIFRSNALENLGVDALREHLVNQSRQIEARSAGGRFRLAIDRSFTLQGAGLVITGTVFAGRVQSGDRLRIAPKGLDVRVRGIRAEDAESETGVAGQRCALNVAGQGLKKTDIKRGDWALDPALDVTSDRLDASLRLLASEANPLAHWTPVHVHLGSGSLTGRVATLDTRKIEPGREGLVQLVLDSPIHALHGDAFILRDQSAQRTIAGGTVLDPFAPKRGRAKPSRLQQLTALGAASARDALEQLSNHDSGVELKRFALARNLPADEVEALRKSVALVDLSGEQTTVSISQRRFEALSKALLTTLERWHGEHTDQLGPDAQALLDAVDDATSRTVALGVLQQLLANGCIHREGLSLRLPSHRPQLSREDREFWQAASKHLAPKALKPPVVTELAELLAMDKAKLVVALSRCARRGQLTRVAQNRYFHPLAVANLARIAESLSATDEEGGFDAKTYRDASGIGRNLAIQVLEFFDGLGFTYRIGDRRRIRRPSADVFGPRSPSDGVC